MALTLVLTAGALPAATVTIDLTTTHQTFEGLTATRDNISTWQEKVGPFYQTVDLNEVGFYDSIAQDWHMARLALEPIQDTLDAPYNDIDLTHVLEMRDAGITRFWASPFSPPAWMKDNQSFTNGGSLLPEYYDEFSYMLAEYCRQFKEQTGLDLYGLCLQVEPGFVEPYGSCVYTGTTYRDLMAVAGPIIDSVSPNTKILAPQDVLNSFYSRSNQWIRMLMEDSATQPHVDIYAVNLHNSYFDSANAPARAWWDAVRAVADPNGLPLWLSSTGDRLDTTYEGSVRIAAAAANTFKYGNAAVWTWFSFCTGSDWSLIKEGRYTDRYYQNAHFGRFIKPGAVRVDSDNDGPSALADVAFENTDGSLAIVLVNGTGAAEDVTLDGTGLPTTFHAYQTTGATTCLVDIGDIQSANQLGLPAMSTTTLVSDATQATRPEATPRAPAASRVSVTALPGRTGVLLTAPLTGRLSAELYSPRGDCVARVAVHTAAGDAVTLRGTGRLASGMYVVRAVVQGPVGALERAVSVAVH